MIYSLYDRSLNDYYKYLATKNKTFHRPPIEPKISYNLEYDLKF